MNKLIIVRGPSGSGKSTIAKALFEKAEKPVAFIAQDYYRFMFKPAGGGGKYNSSAIHQMIKNDVLIALENRYDVILEGILSEKSYGTVLEEIFKCHPAENYMFYLDVSLEETMRRHETRVVSGPAFDAEKMRSWYAMAHRSNHRLERIIPEDSSLGESLDFIIRTAHFRA